MVKGVARDIIAKWHWVLLLAVWTGIYVLVNGVLTNWGGTFFHTYIIQPLLWGAVAGYVWWLPRVRPAGRRRLHRLINWLALLCAGFQVLFLLVGGLVEGFGRSPYSFTFFGVLNNMLFVSASLAGTELSRAFLVNSLAGRRSAWTIGWVSLFFTALSLPWSKITSLQTNLDLVKFTGGGFLPALAENLLASYLAYLGGPVAAAIYRGTLEAFQWFCPILPNLSWPTKTLLGTFIPLFSLILVHRLYLAEARELKKQGGDESPAGWILTSAAAVLMVWFAVGLFPIYPSVILSGSMEPGIKKGDIVLIRKVPGAEVKTGDIIQFWQGKMLITHRVVQVAEKKGAKVWVTKGDANRTPDPEPVYAHQVVGKVCGVIPKVGWITLFLKSLTVGVLAGNGGCGPQSDGYVHFGGNEVLAHEVQT
ncbi:MAG: signal peptidase I [Moorellaceae bacterium]